MHLYSVQPWGCWTHPANLLNLLVFLYFHTKKQRNSSALFSRGGALD